MRDVALNWRKPFSLLVLAATLVLCAACSAGGSDEDAERAKSVILFIGDGMGVTHREAIRLSTIGLEEASAMDSLRYSGLSRTNPAGDVVADSAAAATALASGVKTYNGTVGLTVGGERVTTILEEAKEAGKSTGLVTTSQVTDATPAAFAAHVPNRKDQSEIARQYVEESRPDVILGGGRGYWYPEGDPRAYPDGPPEDSTQKSQDSEGSLVDLAEQSGYEYVSDPDGLMRTEGPKVLGLFANQAMFREGTEGEGLYEPAAPLPAMTAKAIEVLSRNDQGFFLLVEEEAIDGMSHHNNAELMLEAGKQLDEAVRVGRSYAENNPDTLLIVAADHETGGLGLERPDGSDDGPFRVATTDQEFELGWTTLDHTAAPVPVTAEGPGADGLAGVYDHTHVYDVMREALLGKTKETQ